VLYVRGRNLYTGHRHSYYLGDPYDAATVYIRWAWVMRVYNTKYVIIIIYVGIHEQCNTHAIMVPTIIYIYIIIGIYRPGRNKIYCGEWKVSRPAAPILFPPRELYTTRRRRRVYNCTHTISSFIHKYNM